MNRWPVKKKKKSPQNLERRQTVGEQDGRRTGCKSDWEKIFKSKGKSWKQVDFLKCILPRLHGIRSVSSPLFHVCVRVYKSRGIMLKLE